MGLFHRLFSGAEQRDGNRDRSPEEARSDAPTRADFRALKESIDRLAATLGEGDVTPSSSGRSRRGGKGRRRADGDRERDRDRDRGSDRQQRHEPRRGLPAEPPEDAPTGPLVDYLRERKFIVYEGQDDLGSNEAFDHLARHIGAHFDLISPFYEKMKKAVASGSGTRVKMDKWSEAERSAAVQLGTMLYRHGMLKDFYYHRKPELVLRVIPTKDGETAQFLTGGWLEIYVAWLLGRRLKARMSPAKFQILFNVKGRLPKPTETGKSDEFEADLMALVDGRMFWIECKTGKWQDYAQRFKILVDWLGCDRQSAALLLARAGSAAERRRVSDMQEMTMISLDEVDGFINSFLGVSEEEAALDRRALRAAQAEDGVLPLGVVPPLSEDEIPLEDAEPAKKLGHVDLGGGSSSESESGSGGRRRRRGRRGGRGRRRASGEGEAAAAPVEAGERKLLEPVKIEPIDDEEGAAAAEAQPAAEATGSSDAPAPSSRRRRRRRSSPFAEDAAPAEVPEAAPEETPADSEEVDAVVAEAEEVLQRAAEAVAEIAEATGQAAEDSEDEEAGSDEEAEASGEEGGTKRRRRRRRGGRGRGKSEEVAESEPESDEVVPEPEAEPEAELDPQAEAEAEEALEETAEPVAEAEPEPEPEPESVSSEKKSALGVTIAPDLAAMIAKPKDAS